MQFSGLTKNYTMQMVTNHINGNKTI